MTQKFIIPTEKDISYYRDFAYLPLSERNYWIARPEKERVKFLKKIEVELNKWKRQIARRGF